MGHTRPDGCRLNPAAPPPPARARQPHVPGAHHLPRFHPGTPRASHRVIRRRTSTLSWAARRLRRRLGLRPRLRPRRRLAARCRRATWAACSRARRAVRCARGGARVCARVALDRCSRVRAPPLTAAARAPSLVT
jgi:hypothetical protein